LTFDPDEVVDNEDEGILVFRSSNIQNDKLSLLDNVYVNKVIPSKLKTKAGDILICSRNGSRQLIGKNALITEDVEGNTFGAFMTLFRSKYWHFLSKVFQSEIFRAQSGLYLTSTINQLTINTLNNIIVPLPPNEVERNYISNFLDKEITHIDNLIDKKQTFIETLKEKRISIISHAVTKGLNKNVKFKVSDIEWLSEVPEHWEEKALKYVCTINDQTLPETTDPEYELNYVDIGSIDKTLGIVNKEKYIFEEAPSRARRIVKDGDILVSTVRTYLRAIAPVIEPEDNLIVSTGFAVIRPQKINSEYLSFLLRSKYFVEKVVSMSVGVSYPAINASALGKIKIPIPEQKEQIQISVFLKKESSSIDKLVELTEKHIEKLQEYKTALISSVVTGKIKVTE
jgi:type I restriction enzyme S subunit